MKVKIGSKTYTAISGLSFIPETDVVGTSVPVNEFVINVYTDDSIRNGADIELRDDRNILWAKYWITAAERVASNVVQVRAQSKIMLLERVTLPAVKYNNATLLTALNTVFASLGNNAFAVDTALDNNTVISGFCPEQTARERLLWLCFVAGAYVKTFFTDTILILPVDDTEVPVPMEQTFYKPSITYDDYVTAVEVTYYTFTQGTPQTTDKWVTDGVLYYIVTSNKVTLLNSNVPETAAENVIKVDGVTLINSANVDDICSHLAKYYFERVRMDLDIVNNANYAPGQRLLVYADEDTMVTGYASKMEFSFGLQARAKVSLIAAQLKASGNLVITYKWGTMKLKRIKYTFPVGYTYQIVNPYIDTPIERHRYVFRPVNQYATGTIAEGANTNNQTCEVALDLDRDTNILHIISVDEVETTTEDNITIGNIA